MEQHSISPKTAVATRWSAVTEIIARLISPITNMLLARLLTPEAFGVVATVTMVVSFADMFTDAGFQKYLIQHDFASKEELDQNTNVAFWSNIILSVVLWGVVSLFSEPLAVQLGNPGLGNVIIVAMLSLILTSFSSIQMARFKRDFDFKSLFYIRLLTSVIPLVITVPLAIWLRSYWALVIGTLAGNLVKVIALTAKSSWKPNWFFKWSILKKMFSYSWWILLESISVWLSSYVGTFIVGIFLTTYYVGLYKTSMTTVTQVIDIIVAATSGPLFSALSRLKNDKDTLLGYYYDFIHGLSLLIIPLGVGIFLYKDLVTEILLGEQWREASNFVGLWGLTSAVSLLLGTYSNGLYNAMGKTKLSFLAQILHLAVLIPVLLMTAPLGFEKLYIARSIMRLQLVLVQMLIMKIIVKAPIWKMIKGLWPAACCTLIMIVVAGLLQSVGNSFVWQLASVVICMLSYFIALFVLFRKQMGTALELFGLGALRKLKTTQ